VAVPVEGVLESFYVEVGQEIFQNQLIGKIRNPKLDSAEKARAGCPGCGAESCVGADDGTAISEIGNVARDCRPGTRAHNEIDRLQKDYEKQAGLWNAGATPRLAWEKAKRDYENAQEDAKRAGTSRRMSH